MKDVAIRLSDTDYGAQPGSGEQPVTLHALRAALRRQLVPLLLCTLLGLGLGFTHYLTSPKQYYSAAKVLVDDRMNQLTGEISAGVPLVRNDTSLLNEIEVLHSLQLASEVVARLDLHRNDSFLHTPNSLARRVLSGVKGAFSAAQSSTDTPQGAQMQGAALALQRSIRVDRVGRSFAINIAYMSHDPDLAAAIVNTYAEAYLDDHLSANLAATNRTAEWMRTRLAETQTASREVADQIAALRDRDASGPALRELARRAETLEALQQTLSERFEQIAIQGSYPATSGRILTRAVTPGSPAAPKAWQRLSLGLLLGLIAGLAIAVLRETGPRSMRDGEDVRALTGQAFLGHMPLLGSAGIPRDQAEVFAASRTGSSHPSTQERDQVRAVVPDLFASVLEPRSTLSRTLRNIHISLELAIPSPGGKIIGITSPVTGAGTTTLAANYANLLAGSGARTLLVDADIWHTTLTQRFQCGSEPGMVEVLRGTCPLEDAIWTLPHTGLRFLPAATAPQQSHAGEMFHPHRLTALITDLRKQYDHVIFDLPPLTDLVDVKAMLPKLDRLVLVCEWAATPGDLVAQTLSREPDIAAKTLGIVLSKSDPAKVETFLQGPQRKAV